MEQQIKITFPDGAVRQYNKGSSAVEVAKSIAEGLAKKVIAAEVNGQIWDATRSIEGDVNLKFLTWDDKGGKNTFWHSSAHLMAEAIESTFPGVKFWVGPPVDNGFYYDVDLGDHSISSKSSSLTLKENFNGVSRPATQNIFSPTENTRSFPNFTSSVTLGKERQ